MDNSEQSASIPPTPPSEPIQPSVSRDDIILNNTIPAPKKSKRLLIFVILGFVFFAIGLAAYFIVSSKTSNTGITASNFDKMTKEQAIAFLKKNYGHNYLPEGFVDQRAALNGDLSAYHLLYSYENEADIPQIADDSVMNLYHDTSANLDQRFKIEKVSDVYSVVTQTDKVIRNAADIRYLGICFNKNFVDYSSVEETDEKGGLSLNDRLIFKKLDKSTVEEGLKVYAATQMYGHLAQSYVFEDLGDEYKLRINAIGIGITAFKATSEHTIDTYYIDWSVDKKTGRVEAVYANPTEHSRYFVVNSYNLTDSEYDELIKLVSDGTTIELNR